MLMNGRDAGQLLIDALGLNHTNVKWITITAAVDGLATVTVCHYLDEEKVDFVCHELRKLQPHDREEEP